MSRRLIGLLIAGVLLVATISMVASLRSRQNVVTADFTRTTSLYAGAKVKVLGVDIGSVEKITFKGTKVEVVMSYDSSVRLPAAVHALVVPPSIVGDRYVQLAPAYDSGPVLPDGARLGLDHTGVPLELDETFESLDKLAVGLGPKGANKDGSLSRLVTATAKSLDGRGKQFNSTVRELAAAMNTLAGSSEDITGTVTQVGDLTETLAAEDPEMRDLVISLAEVSEQLNGQRGDIASAVESLGEALELVSEFTRANRSELRTTVEGLADVSGTLERRTDELSQVMDLAPVGLTNLWSIQIPTNFDPTKPWETGKDGRTGSANLRAALFNDLDVQLGFTFTALCAQLPAAQQQQLSPFCSALNAAGGSLGGVLSEFLNSSGGSTPVDGATTMSGLLGGVG